MRAAERQAPITRRHERLGASGGKVAGRLAVANGIHKKLDALPLERGEHGTPERRLLANGFGDFDALDVDVSSPKRTSDVRNPINEPRSSVSRGLPKLPQALADRLAPPPAQYQPVAVA